MKGVPVGWRIRHLVEDAEAECARAGHRRNLLAAWPDHALEDLACGWMDAPDEVAWLAGDILAERQGVAA